MINNSDNKYWLPTTIKEAKRLGWNEIDVVLFSGDAYIDHPAFGTAVIGRIIEAEGLSIAIVPQPNWRDDLRDFKKFGKPNLFFAVTAGSMDSMVNHYTAGKRLRSNDAYSPNGQSGFRPDYPTIVYTQILKNLFPDTPVIIGGIEASLRRFTHFDYWKDVLKPSILIESKADLLIYGMGENTIKQVCKLIKRGVPVENLSSLPQVASVQYWNSFEKKKDDIILNSHEVCLESKKKFAENFKTIEVESNKIKSARIIQQVESKIVVVNAPNKLMTEKEMDSIWELPFNRLPHPKYKDKKIPAFEMIKHSVNSHRGCFGGCSFCTISAHQGKHVVSRSEKSIIEEIHKIIKMPEFKGYISDIGGPSANMYKMMGKDLKICETCKRPSCIYPSKCNNLNIDHSHLLGIYNKATKLPGIKKVFIGSGIRYDMLYDNEGKMTKDGERYAKKVIMNHVSGRLKVAPEHTQSNVLKIMRKQPFAYFTKFQRFFNDENRKAGLNQQLIPYFISSHPGCTWEDMAELAIKVKNQNVHIEQIQDFTPTPMTLATVMYYTGLDPYSLKRIKVVGNLKDKNLQRSFFFWNKHEERQKIKRFLQKEKRIDIFNKLIEKKNKK